MRGRSHVRLDEYVTATNTVEDYSTGDLVISRADTFNFWAKITDNKSVSSVLEDKRRDNKKVTLICRTRDVENVDIGTELSLDSNTFLYQVEDKYSSDFKFHSTIEAYAIIN